MTNYTQPSRTHVTCTLPVEDRLATKITPTTSTSGSHHLNKTQRKQARSMTYYTHPAHTHVTCTLPVEDRLPPRSLLSSPPLPSTGNWQDKFFSSEYHEKSCVRCLRSSWNHIQLFSLSPTAKARFLNWDRMMIIQIFLIDEIRSKFF